MNYKCPYCKHKTSLSSKPPVHCSRCGSLMVQQQESFAKTGCGIIVIMILVSLGLAHFSQDVRSASSNKTNKREPQKKSPKKQIDLSPVLNEFIGKHKLNGNVLKLYFVNDFDDFAVIYSIQASQYLSRCLNQEAIVESFSIDHPEHWLVKIVSSNSEPSEFYYKENPSAKNPEIERKRIKFCKNQKIKIAQDRMQTLEYNKFYRKHVSSLDDSILVINRKIKSMMNDPSSFKHEKTDIYTIKDKPGWYLIRTHFRGKNMYGAIIMNQAQFHMSQSGEIIGPITD